MSYIKYKFSTETSDEIKKLRNLLSFLSSSKSFERLSSIEIQCPDKIHVESFFKIYFYEVVDADQLSFLVAISLYHSYYFAYFIINKKYDTADVPTLYTISEALDKIPNHSKKEILFNIDLFT